jgi:hypothetical protein
MTFTRGVPRPLNAGRKKGSLNKRTVALAETSQKAIQSGLTPLEFLLGILRDPAKDDRLRLDAAKAAAPYVHPKASDNSATVVADPNKSSQQLREELAQYLAVEDHLHDHHLQSGGSG